jgi:hypothetical protein
MAVEGVGSVLWEYLFSFDHSISMPCSRISISNLNWKILFESKKDVWIFGYVSKYENILMEKTFKNPLCLAKFIRKCFN